MTDSNTVGAVPCPRQKMAMECSCGLFMPLHSRTSPPLHVGTRRELIANITNTRQFAVLPPVVMLLDYTIHPPYPSIKINHTHGIVQALEMMPS